MEIFNKALDIDPAVISNHFKLAQSLEAQNRYDNAIAALKRGIGYLSSHGQKDTADQLREYLDIVVLRKLKRQK